MIDLIVQSTAHASTDAVTVLSTGLAAGITGAGAIAALILHGLHAAVGVVALF